MRRDVRAPRETPDRRFLTFDHVDVIGSVSDGQRHGLLVLLHQTHHVGLLFGRDAAADHGFTLAGHVHEVQLQIKKRS